MEKTFLIFASVSFALILAGAWYTTTRGFRNWLKIRWLYTKRQPDERERHACENKECPSPTAAGFYRLFAHGLPSASVEGMLMWIFPCTRNVATMKPSGPSASAASGFPEFAVSRPPGVRVWRVSAHGRLIHVVIVTVDLSRIGLSTGAQPKIQETQAVQFVGNGGFDFLLRYPVALQKGTPLHIVVAQDTAGESLFSLMATSCGELRVTLEFSISPRRSSWSIMRSNVARREASLRDSKDL